METSNCDNVSDCDTKVSFWRKNTKVVPGRPSPKKENHMSNPLTRISGSSSFNEFQASVNDAWDMGDDEFCIISGETERKLCKKSSQSSSSIITKDASNLAVHSSNHTKTTVVNKPKEVINDSKSISNVEEDRGSCDPKPTTKRRSLGPECVSYPGRPHALGTGVLSARDTDCESKMDRFQILLSSALLDLSDLRELSWSGIPVKVRAITWKLLCDYLPTSLERREGVLKRKREEYWNFVKQYYDIERDEAYKDTYRQIHIDIPRMNPLITLFQQLIVQEMFERILFIWAIRHPASGYVQGINDLVTPFFVVFLQEVISTENIDSFDTSTLTQTQRDIIEADSFWCLSKFLDNIQDNYIFAQLGIQQKVNQLKELIKRINEPLHRHLVSHGVDYLQFSFRWMNNSLTRELPLHCVIRLWDTYLAESDGFATFQLYVCAAFLLHWKNQLLQEQDFQGLLLLLQNLPTQSWTNSHISLLVAEAYKLKFTFADAPNHLQSSKSVR